MVYSLLFSMAGAPMIVYGDEIGMENTPIPKGDIKDPAEQDRDPQRTPMQWTEGPNAGFTEGTPWVNINSNNALVNVAMEGEDPDSMLSLYRRIIELRSRERALSVGPFRPIGTEGDMFAFILEDPDSERRFLVVVNPGHDAGVYEVPSRYRMEGEVVLGSDRGMEGRKVGMEIGLSGDQGIIALLHRPHLA